MFRKALGLLATVAVGLGVAQSAFAADMPIKAPPPPVVVRNWTSCYIGINGGYGWAPKDFSDVTSGASLGSHTAQGGVVGGQLGCDYQTGPWVFGIRGMFDWADMTGSHTDPAGTIVYKTRVKSFETAVGRVGYTLLPNTLVYALGGFAWVQDRHTLNTLAGAETGFANITRTGYTVGAGLEYMFAPGWSASIEYDYLHCGCVIPITPVPGPPPGAPAPPPAIDIHQNVSLVLVGVNYRFSIR